MTDTTASFPRPDREPGTHRVHLVATVQGTSAAEAARSLNTVLSGAVEGGQPREEFLPAVDKVISWNAADQSAFSALESFEDSGIPDLLAEMFPPEPTHETYRQSTGSLDEDGFEEAHEEWRERCLDLAVAASHLPELLERLERAERVRDGVLDVTARFPIPERPEPAKYVSSSVQKPFNIDAYEHGYGQWLELLDMAARGRDRALKNVLDEAGPRTSYLPLQFQREWVPRDLMARTVLRTLLDAAPAQTGWLLDRETRGHLEAMMFASDPAVRVADPDDPAGPPIYEGAASEAHRWIPAGVYKATGLSEAGHFRVVVGRASTGPETMASAAFPPADHDSSALDEIARVLETAPENASHDVLLEQVRSLIAGTGRTDGQSGMTMLEQGVLLGDLLALRGLDLGQNDVHSSQLRPGDERGMI